ncbi:MAG: ROK family transcriptional regulator [Solirubrobacteraceae bacterium]|nr:ROK family transcriptional regulator [Solirubrobacteraceae bacterium]
MSAGRSENAPLSTRRRNRVQVLDALRSSGSASRADLARRTGLSRSTISGLITELIGDGLVVDRAETRDPGAQGGRPGALLSLDRSAGAALAIDFGHTHLRVALADLSAEILAERELKIDVDGSASAALDAAAELTREVLEEAELTVDDLIGAAMGLPGPIDRATGAVGSSVILPDWVGLQPAQEFAHRLGAPVGVIVDNDANLATLGEARFGAAIGATDLVYVKVASGIGAGILLGGRLHRGAAGSAGELGHVLHDAEGDICRCGNRGCLETVAGAAPLLRLLRHRHGPELTTRGMAELAMSGDVGARRVLIDAGRAIGRSLADLSNILGPDQIVIGGDLGGEGSALIDGIRESLGRFALPAVVGSVELSGGQLGNRAELLGGLSLVIGDTERLSSSRMGVTR